MLLSCFKQTITECTKDNVPRLGAALAYYTILSLAPMLVVILNFIALILGRSNAKLQVIEYFSSSFGIETAQLVEGLITNGSVHFNKGILSTILGIIMFLVGASTALGELRNALNIAWDVPQKPESIIKSILKERLIGLASLLWVGLLLLISLIISTWFGLFSSIVTQVSTQFLSVVMCSILFATLYKILPDIKVKWSDALAGGVVASVLFNIGKFALGFYLGSAAFGSLYGAAGSIIILLLWIYYSAQIFLFGAEFSQVYSKNTAAIK